MEGREKGRASSNWNWKTASATLAKQWKSKTNKTPVLFPCAFSFLLVPCVSHNFTHSYSQDGLHIHPVDCRPQLVSHSATWPLNSRNARTCDLRFAPEDMRRTHASTYIVHIHVVLLYEVRGTLVTRLREIQGNWQTTSFFSQLHKLWQLG